MARVLIIGGTGVISAHCTSGLLGLGHQVTLLHRGTARVSAVRAGFATIRCDRNDRAGLAGAIAATDPEVIIDFACFSLSQATDLAAALNRACRQLVLVSTVDVYGLPLAALPMREAGPWSEPGSAYAAAKRQVEAGLRAGLASTGTALTILRPTYSMGDAFMISLFDRSGAELVARLRRGDKILLPDGGVRLIHPSDARDTGRMVAMAAACTATFGRDYTVGTPGGMMSQRDYVVMIAQALNVAPNVHEVPAADLLQPGVLAPDSLWLELTRHDLSYDMARFLDDVPGFVAMGGLAGPVQAYSALLDPAEDAARAQGPEAHALRALARTG